MVFAQQKEAVQCAVLLGDLATNDSLQIKIWRCTMVDLPLNPQEKWYEMGDFFVEKAASMLRNSPNSLLEFHFHFSRRLLEQDLFRYAQKGMGWWWMLDVDAFNGQTPIAS